MFGRLQFWIVIALLIGALPAAAQEKTEEAQPSQAKAENTASTAPKAAATDANYIIGGQDMLDINVWKEAELSRSVQVRPDGKISLPLLNDVQAAGLTPTQLAAQLTDGLKKYVTDPQVTVMVTQINSQRIYILGEVNRAGAYPLLPAMTILQGLSSAGGFTQFANQKKIYMFRVENGKQVKFPFNYKDVIDGKQPDENVILKAGDTIVVP